MSNNWNIGTFSDNERDSQMRRNTNANVNPNANPNPIQQQLQQQQMPQQTQPRQPATNVQQTQAPQRQLTPQEEIMFLKKQYQELEAQQKENIKKIEQQFNLTKKAYEEQERKLYEVNKEKQMMENIMSGRSSGLTSSLITQPFAVQSQMMNQNTQNLNSQLPSAPRSQVVTEIMGAESSSLVAAIKQNARLAATGNRYASLDAKFDPSVLTGAEKQILIIGGKYSCRKDNFRDVVQENLAKSSGFQNSQAVKSYNENAIKMIEILQKCLWKNITTKEEMASLRWANIYRNKELRREVYALWEQGNAREIGSTAWLYWNASFASGSLTQEVQASLANRLRVMRIVCQYLIVHKLDIVGKVYTVNIDASKFQKLEQNVPFNWSTVNTNNLNLDEALRVVEIVDPFKFKQFPEVKQDPSKYIQFVKSSFVYMLQMFQLLSPRWNSLPMFALLNKWDGQTRGSDNKLTEFASNYFELRKRVVFAIRYAKKAVYGGKRGIVNRWGEKVSMTNFMPEMTPGRYDGFDIDDVIIDQSAPTSSNDSQDMQQPQDNGSVDPNILNGSSDSRSQNFLSTGNSTMV